MRVHGRWVAVVAALMALSACVWAGLAGAAQAAHSPAATGWRVVKTWGCGFGAVNSVTAGGPRSAWATGFLTRCSSHREDLLIARWDGRSWRQVRPPAGFADDGKSVGDAVAALSASYSWTFVLRSESQPDAKSFALLYQNGHWRTFSLPDPVPFSSAVVFSRSNAWAFSENGEAVRFNGHAWRRVLLPVHAESTASPGPRNIWAVGGAGENLWPDKLAHWTGQQWHTVTFPDISTQFTDSFSNSVVSDGGNGAWDAVTDWGTEGIPNDGVLLHWTGSAWASPITAPSPLATIGPMAHDGHGGLWMAAGTYQACGPTGCSSYEMVRYSPATGWSTPVSIGLFQVNTMRLISGTHSLWAGGFSYTFDLGGGQRATHAAILKFGL